MKIYNLFPLLAGRFNDWHPHLERAASMCFDWVFTNPVQEPGLSGSIYSIKDYLRFNPLLVDEGSGVPPKEQFKSAMAQANRLGLSMLTDLVINHCAVDSPLVNEHPEWFRRDKSGKVEHPWCMDGKRKVVWGDLARFDHKGTSDPDGLFTFVQKIIGHLVSLGFRGFRCDAAYQLPPALWERIIKESKNRHGDIVFAAETLGCTHDETMETARAGFDYIFNSSKWWDFKSRWLLDQYKETRAVCHSISFPESHDTLRLFEELNGNLSAIKLKYLFSAFFSSSVMMPMGFEFGFRKRPHVVKTRPADWEETGIDISSFIKDVNRIKSETPILNLESRVEEVASDNPDVLILLKSSEDGEQKLLLVINKDMENSIALKEQSASNIMGTPRQISNITPKGMSGMKLHFDLQKPLDITLPPAACLVLNAG